MRILLVAAALYLVQPVCLIQPAFAGKVVRDHRGTTENNALKPPSRSRGYPSTHPCKGCGPIVRDHRH